MRREGLSRSMNPYSYYNVPSTPSFTNKALSPPLLKAALRVTIVAILLLFVFLVSAAPPCHYPPLVISHRAAFPPSATKSLAKDVSALLPPGSVKSVAALSSRGVCAFDVDVFATADASLVVGHPDEVRRRLHLKESPTSLTLALLRELDGGETATVEEFIEAAKDCKDSGVDPKLSGGGAQAKLRLLFELKGDSATSQSLQSISKSAKAAGVGVSETGVWVQEVRRLA